MAAQEPVQEPTLSPVQPGERTPGGQLHQPRRFRECGLCAIDLHLGSRRKLPRFLLRKSRESDRPEHRHLQFTLISVEASRNISQGQRLLERTDIRREPGPAYGVPALAGDTQLGTESSECLEPLSTATLCRLKPGLHTLCVPSPMRFPGSGLTFFVLLIRFREILDQFFSWFQLCWLGDSAPCVPL